MTHTCEAGPATGQRVCSLSIILYCLVLSVSPCDAVLPGGITSLVSDAGLQPLQQPLPEHVVPTAPPRRAEPATPDLAEQGSLAQPQHGSPLRDRAHRMRVDHDGSS